MPIIVENLTHIYMKGMPYEKKALDNINLKIDDGEFVAIIGHTGSGKSTLVQHFNGLLKPTSGRVIIDNIDITTKDLKQLRRNVGMVFQYPEHQLFDETVYKDISFGLQKMGLSKEEMDRRIHSAASVLGIDDDMLQKSPFELSGGQKRRVAIAGVIVMQPKVLIMDEPAAGLDPSGRDEIFNLILNLHKERNMTIIMISHDMEEVAKLVDRIIVMNQGRIEMDGKVSEVFKDIERLEKIGLSAPRITYLMRKLKKKIPYINDNIYTVEQAKKEILRYIKENKDA